MPAAPLRAGAETGASPLAGASSVRLGGYGLHSGRRSGVMLQRAPGPLAFLWAHREPVERAQLTVVRADMGVQVAAPTGERLDLVEHLLAGVGALGATSGLWIVPAAFGSPGPGERPPPPSGASSADGGEASVPAGGLTFVELAPEVPLLDGGAAGFCRALRELGFGGGPAPVLRVRRDFDFAHGASRYALRPSSGIEMDVTIDFDHPAIGRQRVAWSGDGDDFIARFAPARTFGFVRDLGALQAAGRALGARADAGLVAFDERGPVNTELQWADEPARHKLLDLVGDVTLYGGPILGVLRAERPGHAASLAMMRAALAAGAIG